MLIVNCSTLTRHVSVSHRPVPLWESVSCCSWSCSCSSCCSGRWWRGWTAISCCVWVLLKRTRRWMSRLSEGNPASDAREGPRSWAHWTGGHVCETCACDADSACEGSVCGAWLRCAVGCWAVSDMAGCGGWAWIWLLAELGRDKSTFIYNRLWTISIFKWIQIQINSVQIFIYCVELYYNVQLFLFWSYPDYDHMNMISDWLIPVLTFWLKFLIVS